MTTFRRRVFTISPDVGFLPAFAKALLAGEIIQDFPAKDDPFSLSKARIFVPTRRAARALTTEIAELVTQRSVLLPSIVPLGAMDESETASFFESDALLFERPDVVSEGERRLVLAEMILAWGRSLRNAILYVDGSRFVTNADEPMLVTTSPAQAYQLAGDLASLIDEMTIEGIDPGQLKFLLPEGLDKYWGITLEFLKIAFEAWPAYLAERGLEDRAQRQAALIEYEISRLQSDPDPGPQIVIGSTGTNFATAKLIAAIAALRHGAVVLPGLDLDMDDATWSLIGGTGKDGQKVQPAYGHPQAAMRRLLDVMEISRDDVQETGARERFLKQRMDLVREALRPAESTEHWLHWRNQTTVTQLAESLAGVTYIDADDERMEALSIAIALREALVDPATTAALVTPDRDLARRVRAELRRWKIEADDSGGDPLSGEPAGIFAKLVLECASASSNNAAILALLDHSSVRLGYTAPEFERLRSVAEIAVLRGATWNVDEPEKGIAIAKAAAQEPHAHRLKRAIADEDWPALETFFNHLRDALLPLRSLQSEGTLRAFIDAHSRVIAALKTGACEEDEVLAGEDDLALQNLFETFYAIDHPEFALTFDSYSSLFSILSREATVRGPRRAHPRVKILGLLEARLLSADVMVLAGLDESVWPPAARTDAFLNRPMRAELGLSSPERRIGQTAHDFVEAMGATKVILSRAKKRGGSPAVPSRFIQRLQALAGDSWDGCEGRGKRLIQLAHYIDNTPGEPKPVKRPEPRPAIDLRPKGLSITQIEKWRRDPYSIYAQRILKLEPLEAVDAEDGLRETGTRLHEVFSAFHLEHPAGPLPDNALDRLISLARRIFTAQLNDPDFATFKWPDIQASFKSFIEWESERREVAVRIEVEQSGKYEITLNDGSIFTLTGRADRLEADREKQITIIDYKSGTIPTKKQINAGFTPQLTLEAAMIERGAFKCFPSGTQVSRALYIPIGKEGEIKPGNVGNSEKSFDQLVKEHFDGLIELANQFRDPQTPYLARPLPEFKDEYGEYDHLARVKEWASNTDEES